MGIFISSFNYEYEKLNTTKYFIVDIEIKVLLRAREMVFLTSREDHRISTLW